MGVPLALLYLGKADSGARGTRGLRARIKELTRFGRGEPGIDNGAVGADTWGVEAVPFANPNRIWEGHQTLLAKNGIHILEVMDTRALARDRATEFLFVLGQPLLKGAVQAIINPIAIK